MNERFFSIKKIIFVLLTVTSLTTKPMSAPHTANMIPAIGSFVSEHKLAITTLVVLGIGWSLKKLCTHDTHHNKLVLKCLNNTANAQTVFLFAHGVDPRASASIQQPTAYIDNNIINGPCYTFNFNDRLATLNFGQARDCSMLANAYEHICKKHPQAHVVLVGVSRGASTIINTLGSHKEYDWSQVKAIILESPYDHVDSLVAHIAHSYIYYMPYGKTILKNLINRLPSYNSEGLQTVQTIEGIPNIPIFIGYSESDKTVSPESTRKLISKARLLQKEVTCWGAQSGRHSTLAYNPTYIDQVCTFLIEHVQTIKV